MAIRAMHVDLLVETDSEKQLSVLHRLIVFVLKTTVLVLMVPKLLELLVLHMIPVLRVNGQNGHEVVLTNRH